MERLHTRPILFLSDFGFRNELVGLCHSVIARIAPESRIIDLSHGVPPEDVLRAALLLSDCLHYAPEDAVLLAVVDPGVGTGRKDVAIETSGGRLLVGPDNGVLSLALQALGGAARAVEIASPDVLLDPVAATLHARDVLCPGAAHLATGTPLDRLGPLIEVAELVSLGLPEPELGAERIQCEVLDLDRFGNVQLSVREEHLTAAGLDGAADLGFESTSTSIRAKRVAAYADVAVADYGALIDHRGWLALVRNRANAAEGLGVLLGDPVWVTLPSGDSARP
jgi:S-adenosyl-L-methionine hydrolase (adenosine-forming)